MIIPKKRRVETRLIRLLIQLLRITRPNGERILKRCRTLDEALERCPEEIRGDDWRRWCVWEYSDEFMKISQQNKKNRKELPATHTSGRNGYARTIHKMREEAGDPTLEVTLPDAFVRLRTQKDGDILPAAEPIVEKIKESLDKMKESQGESSTNQLYSTDNLLATICGHKEGRGRLRGRGSLVSSTEYKSSSHAKEKICKLDEHHKEREEKLLGKISDVVNERIREVIPDLVQAFARANAQGTQNNPLAQSIPSIVAQNTLPQSPNNEYSDNTPVELMNWQGNVVATGKVARLGGNLCHGVRVNFSMEERVALVSCLHSDEPLYKPNSFATTLGEVDRNGFVIWPKMSLKYKP